MSQVTIRGRIASTALPAGEVVTVERTDRIDRLVAGGFVEVLHSHDDPAPEPGPEPGESGEDVPEAAVDDDPEDVEPRPRRRR